MINQKFQVLRVFFSYYIMFKALVHNSLHPFKSAALKVGDSTKLKGSTVVFKLYWLAVSRAWHWLTDCCLFPGAVKCSERSCKREKLAEWIVYMCQKTRRDSIFEETGGVRPEMLVFWVQVGPKQCTVRASDIRGLLGDWLPSWVMHYKGDVIGLFSLFSPNE